MDKGGKLLKNIVFIVYLFFGIWFMNEPFQIFPLFEITEWMIALAGFLLIIAGFAVVLTFRKPGMGMPIAAAPAAAPKNMNIKNMNIQRRRQAKARRSMSRRR